MGDLVIVVLVVSPFVILFVLHKILLAVFDKRR